MIEHTFTKEIRAILVETFGEQGEFLLQQSELLRYLNEKTRSVSRGSKSRSSFGSIYAVYVLVEDYMSRGFAVRGNYHQYEGARFSDLLNRQRELPFGSKLQNHALNHRVNQEFAKLFPTCEFRPIIREVETKRYWINENMLQVKSGRKTYNLAAVILGVIDAYVGAKRQAFEGFLSDCKKLATLQRSDPAEVSKFIRSRLEPSVDARVFEIVSFAILKQFYGAQSVFWGWSADEVHEEGLALFKTGRTNANDGGIDFVMQPLGRFFQVTETVDARKYFLDIDKIQRYPLTFVVKSTEPQERLRSKIEAHARRLYAVDRVVARYMDCIEEIININDLLERFEQVLASGKLAAVISEIVQQSKMEFNYNEE